MNESNDAIAGTTATAEPTPPRANPFRQSGAEAKSATRGATDLAAAVSEEYTDLQSLIGEELQSPAPANVRSTSDWEEFVLKDYLDRFLERTVGKKSDAPAEIRRTPAPAPSPAASAVSAAVDNQGETPREPVRAPECRELVGQMREVANQNARSAIATHTRDIFESLRGSYLAAFGACLVSTAFAASTVVYQPIWTWPGAAALCLIATILSLRFLVTYRQFMQATFSPPRTALSLETGDSPHAEQPAPVELGDSA